MVPRPLVPKEMEGLFVHLCSRQSLYPSDRPSNYRRSEAPQEKWFESHHPLALFALLVGYI